MEFLWIDWGISSITQKDQNKIIKYVKKLNQNQLQDNVQSMGLASINNIMNELQINNKSESNGMSLNRYYAEYIIDSLDLNKVYNSTDKDIEFTDEEREILISKLEKANCKRFYEVFKKIGINENEASAYIISLLASDGYKGYSFSKLSNVENLEEILSTNIKNTFLKNRITFYTLEALLDREDNSNLVEGSSIKLRDYQQGCC